MSSSTLASLQLIDYTALATLTAVGYDYVLMFSKEVEYIWNKRWTWVTMLFILVRYAGLQAMIFSSISVSTLVMFYPSTVMGIFQGKIFDLIRTWSFIVFLGAADLVMLLRVWAICHRSKLVLGTLLTTFSLEIIFIILTSALGNVSQSAAVVQIQGYSWCALDSTSRIPSKLAPILQMIHCAAMCILGVTQCMRQVLQIYRVSKQWQVNRYMNLLIRQGILYCIILFVLCTFAVLGVSEKLPSGKGRAMPFTILETVLLYTLMPRFIIDIRELYARDVQGRGGQGVDSGFGLIPDRSAGETGVMFVEVGQGSDTEEISMDVMMTHSEATSRLMDTSPRDFSS